MSNMKKTDQFFEALEKAGLTRSFDKISNIASEKLDCYLEDIVDDFVAEMERPICRVRYEKKPDGSEAYIFETRAADEEEYSFAVLYQMQNDMISYQALTQIREYIKLGYEIRFA